MRTGVACPELRKRKPSGKYLICFIPYLNLSIGAGGLSNEGADGTAARSGTALAIREAEEEAEGACGNWLATEDAFVEGAILSFFPQHMSKMASKDKPQEGT